MLRPPYPDKGISYIRKRTPPDKRRNNKVLIKSKQRRDVVFT